MTTLDRRDVAPGLWVHTEQGPRLIGGSCARCGTTTFPKQASCSRCTAVDSHDQLLPPDGELWSFTVQGFPPKAPYLGPSGSAFVPYGVGYVQLDDVVIVEARLTVADPAELWIGMPMTLVIVPFAVDATGTQVLTFAFSPRVGAS